MAISRRVIFSALGVGAILLAAFLLLPLFGRLAVRGISTSNLSHAKMLANACKLYADDNEGKFPLHLSELVPDYVTENELTLADGGWGYRFVVGEKLPQAFADWFILARVSAKGIHPKY